MTSRVPPVLAVCAASQLAPQPVDWLWPGRLALGKLAMLDGDPGLGKSLVTLDLCARLSTGRPFPDGSVPPGPANALVLNGEDAAADTIRPRLQALGADLERVFLLNHHDLGPAGPLRFPDHVDCLDAVLAQTQARLLVIDPLMAFLHPALLGGSDQGARQALLPLAQLAGRHRCTIPMVRHLNKTGGSQSMYRGGGSIGLIGACRSGWLIARDPQQSGHCVLAQVKNNLAPPQPSLAYRIVSDPAGVPVLEWLGVVPWTADQLLAQAGASSPLPTARARARDFLAGFLEDGPRTSREIWEAAQQQGLTEPTLRRARNELEIRCIRLWADGRRLSYWLLPGQQLPESIPADAVPPDLEPWLAPLREQFPPPTPLDDL